MLSPACPAGKQEPDSSVTVLPGVTPGRPEAPTLLWGRATADRGWRTQNPFWSQGLTTSPTPWESTFPEEKFKIPFFETIVTKCYIPYQLRHLRNSPLVLIYPGEIDNPTVQVKSKSRHTRVSGTSTLRLDSP